MNDTAREATVISVLGERHFQPCHKYSTTIPPVHYFAEQREEGFATTEVKTGERWTASRARILIAGVT